jgi:menaquinone-dependent protoporphyrinogen oxidase
MSVGIFYSTVEGQSAKIAERLALEARDAGFEAVIEDVDRLGGTELPSVEAVILVASVHMGRHERSVGEFVREHRAWLTSRPAAFLSVSLSAASKQEASRHDAEQMLESFLKEVDWRPDFKMTVAGALAYSKYGFFKRLILRAKSRGEGGATDTSHDYEYTDWEALGTRIRQFLSDSLSV